MNRTEALRILGLSADATQDDIKAAYRETAQILHPDRFAGNRKLQERATEQFKNLQEAYEVLTKKRPAAANEGSTGPRRTSGLSEERELEAKLAGIAAARVQLAAQRDALSDERRTGIGFALVGALVALVCARRPAGLLLALAGIASAAALWGIVQVISAQRSIASLDGRLGELTEEKKKLVARLDELKSENAV